MNWRNILTNKVLIITGPTASGKSDFAIKLAKKFGGEIISADSQQIYKDMDIGTNKITEFEMDGICHYGLDIKYPNEDYSVQEFNFSILARASDLLIVSPFLKIFLFISFSILSLKYSSSSKSISSRS